MEVLHRPGDGTNVPLVLRLDEDETDGCHGGSISPCALRLPSLRYVTLDPVSPVAPPGPADNGPEGDSGTADGDAHLVHLRDEAATQPRTMSIIVMVMKAGRVTYSVGFVRYLAKKAAFLVVTLLFALYLTVVIANFGGYVDDILRA